jgi:hypothetical protein
MVKRARAIAGEAASATHAQLKRKSSGRWRVTDLHRGWLTSHYAPRQENTIKNVTKNGLFENAESELQTCSIFLKIENQATPRSFERLPSSAAISNSALN